jgi:hypothetical protein
VSLRQTTRGLRRLAGTLRPAVLAGLAVVVLAAAGAAVIVVMVPGLRAWLASGPVAVAVVAAAAVWRQARAAASRAGQAWSAAMRMAEAQQQRLQTARDVAAAEVAALEREMQDLTAAGQLAGMVADRAASGD